MRPVNLIPPEERRGARAPLRAGIASYALVAALLLAVGAVTALVLAGNDVAERKAEKEELEAELEVATERAEALRSFAELASVRTAREVTVSSLARSRFDWERVLRELAIVIPSDVWLVNVTGTATPGVQLSGAEVTSLRDEIDGPALDLVGCAEGHEAVAGLVAALEDIDGVTRVGVESSERPGGGSGAGDEDCRTRDFIAQFKIIVAFDGVDLEAAGGEALALPMPGGGAPERPQSGTQTPATPVAGGGSQPSGGTSKVVPGAVR